MCPTTCPVTSRTLAVPAVMVPEYPTHMPRYLRLPGLLSPVWVSCLLSQVSVPYGFLSHLVLTARLFAPIPEWRLPVLSPVSCPTEHVPPVSLAARRKHTSVNQRDAPAGQAAPRRLITIRRPGACRGSAHLKKDFRAGGPVDRGQSARWVSPRAAVFP